MSQQSANFGRQRQVEFGCYLRSLRERKNLKQKQVAAELHINLCEIEKGRRSISHKQLRRLAEMYDLPLEEILERKYSPQLPLLTGIIRPTELTEDLLSGLHAEEREEIMEEVKRYTAFLLLRRGVVDKS